MASMVSYVPVLLGTEKKSHTGPTAAEMRISRQIDTLQAISKRRQDEKWGANWYQEMEDFFNLNYFPSTAAPSFRPRVVLPELQYLLMGEATELTSDPPKCYISVNGKRDEKRETAFAANWKRGYYNARIFEAVFISQFCNPGVIQVGFNPETRNGKGSVWIKSRSVDSFFPDGHATNDRDWSYAGAEDWMYPEEVKRLWGAAARNVRSTTAYEDETEESETGPRSDLSMELPDGPLRVGAPEGFEHRKDGPRVRVRYLWIKDYARETVRELAGEKTAQGLELVVKPLMKWKYPGGRFVAECQGYILADGINYVPRLPDDDFSTFPFVGVWSLPHLKHYYGVPPVRYGKSAQDTSERMYTQLIENMFRVNNGQTFIPEDSGIDIDAYGGLPGEVQVYRGDKVPEIKWPNPIPQHMTQVPEILLQKVARYVGWSPARQGESGQGNVAPELFDTAISQGQTLLRMKSRLLAETYQRLTQMVFYMMARFKTTPDQFRSARGEKIPPAVWEPIPSDAELDLELDETSIDTLSTQAMKQLVIALGKTGAVPNKFVLETLGVPNAAQMADEATRQQELAALAKIKRPR